MSSAESHDDGELAEIGAGPTRDWGVLASLAVAGLFVVAVLVLSSFGDVFEYDMDEGNNVIKALLLARGQSLYDEVWSDQPPVLTYLLCGAFKIGGFDVAIGRMLVVLFAGAIVFCVYDVLRVCSGHTAGLAGVGLLLVTRHFLTLSVSVMVGLPSIALAMVCVWAVVRWARGGGLAYVVAGGVLMGASLGVKLFTAFLVPVIGVWVVWLGAKRSAGCGVGMRRGLVAGAGWLAALSLTVGLVLVGLVGVGHVSQLTGTHVDARAGDVYGHGSDVGVLIDRVQADWEFWLLGVVGAIHLVSDRRRSLAIAPVWCVVAVAVLWGHRPVWYHHYLLLSVPGALLAGLAVGESVRRWPAPTLQWRNGLRAVGVGLLAALVVAVAFGWKREYPMPWVGWGAHDRFVVEVMKGCVGEDAMVVTDRQMVAFRAGLAVPGDLSVTSHKRLVTGNLSAARIAQIVRDEAPELVVLSWRFPEPVVTAIREAMDDRYRLVYRGVLEYLDDRDLTVRVFVRDDALGDTMPVLLRAAEARPEVVQAQDFIGLEWIRRGRVQEALASLEQAVRLDPTDPRACQHLAELHMARGYYDLGFAVLDRYLRQSVRAALRYRIARQYAWRRATCPDPAYRDGADAEATIRQVMQGSAEADLGDQATLAAALAAQGRYDSAVALAQRVLARAQAEGDDALAGGVEAALAKYGEGQAWTEPVPVPTP